VGIYLFYLLLALFVVALMAAWFANLFGLPGNWIIVLLVAVWYWFVDPLSKSHIGLPGVILFIGLAATGELIEFAASVFGTRKVGGSRRAATWSVIGSIAGGIVGALVGLPIAIPIVGAIVGSILLACLGAMIGATMGEKSQGSKIDKSLKVGGAAAAGRFIGTVGKFAMGSIIVVATIVSLFI
jgi:hypothetical protein